MIGEHGIPLHSFSDKIMQLCQKNLKKYYHIPFKFNYLFSIAKFSIEIHHKPYHLHAIARSGCLFIATKHHLPARQLLKVATTNLR